MKKKICAFVMLLAMCLTLSVPAFASEQPLDFYALATAETESLNIAEINEYTSAFATLSDDEFDRTIIELIKETNDLDTLQENLLECGVELGDVEARGHTASTRSLGESDVEILLTSAKRTGQTYYHLLVSLEFSDYELYPASKDGVAVYFDSRKADYVGYNSSTDHGFRLMSGQRAVDGTLVFNFSDSMVTMFNYDDSFYTAVYVEPYSGESNITFGADYAHTYADEELDLSGTSIGYSFGAVSSGSVSVNFTIVDEKEEKWEIAHLSSFA